MKRFYSYEINEKYLQQLHDKFDMQLITLKMIIGRPNTVEKAVTKGSKFQKNKIEKNSLNSLKATFFFNSSY